MTIERSHGKPRPTLPRASDLKPIEAAAKPTAGRDSHGHFAGGNTVGLKSRFAATVKKSLGSAAEGPELVVARDARRVFAHVLASLPSDAPPVRALLAVYARHQSLHAYYSLRAEACGLDTEEGLDFLLVADRQSQRAERVLVTCHDIARLHAAKQTAAPALGAWMAGLTTVESESE